MHPELLKVPNVLFYDNRISSGYKKDFDTKFLHREQPILFIDCETEERSYGPSYTNPEESQIVV